LGALQLWHRYQQNPKDTLRDYQATLSLGYTRTIPELYERAGIAFDFSEQRMKELFAFVGREADSYSKALS